MAYLILLPAYVIQWMRATHEEEYNKIDDMGDFDSVMINALGYGFIDDVWQNTTCYK